MKEEKAEERVGRVISGAMVVLLLAGALAAPIHELRVHAWADDFETADGEAAGAEPVGVDDVGEGAGEAASQEVVTEDLEPAVTSDPYVDEGLASLSTALRGKVGDLEDALVTFDALRRGVALPEPAPTTTDDDAADATQRIRELEEQRSAARTVLMLAEEEIALSPQYETIALMTGASSPADVTSRSEMLGRLVVVENQRLHEVDRELRCLRAQGVVDSASRHHELRSLVDVIAPTSQHAYDLERCCSQVRQAVQNVRSAAEAVESSANDATRQVIDEADSALALVRSAEAALGTWYDALDEIGGASGAISFGVGIDFSLGEEAFVEKWGAALDAFYETLSTSAGKMPLSGYGRVMARSAYKNRVDPRLCAAVSIVESSGGLHCIRPHNAWGWGAADSDPYNLAVEWDSWDEAIEAWHVGMANSSSGLASARSVSELGSIYCSSPSWGASVTEQMERIGTIGAKR